MTKETGFVFYFTADVPHQYSLSIIRILQYSVLSMKIIMKNDDVFCFLVTFVATTVFGLAGRSRV